MKCSRSIGEKKLRDSSEKEQIIISFKRLLYNTQEELEKIAIHFHPSHPQPKIINISFRAPVGLLLTQLNHYFDHYTNANMFFGFSKWQKKLATLYTAPLSHEAPPIPQV